MSPEETSMLIDELGSDLARAKAAEQKAKDHRLDVEERILKVAKTKLEGSITTTATRYRITTTGKLNRSLDAEVLEEVMGDVDADVFEEVIKYEPKLNLTAYRNLAKLNKKAFDKLAKAIVTKPAKTSVSVEEIK